MAERVPIREARTTEISKDIQPPDGSASWEAFATAIPLYESVNKELLFQNDDAPFFVALDVCKIGAISEKGLVYDDELVSAIEEQLPGSGGIRGHIPPNAADYAFPIDEVDWVGHVRIDGVTYAKAYIPPGETRNFARRLVARGGKLRTSIRGEGVRETIDKKTQTWRARQFTLDGLDLAPATRAALRRYLSGRVTVTNEMSKGEQDMPNLQDITAADVPSDIREQIIFESEAGKKLQRIAEIESENATLKTEVEELRQYASVVAEIRTTIGSDTDLPKIIAEYHAAMTTLAEMLGVKEYANITVRVEEMHAQVAEYAKAAFDRAVDSAVAELTPWQPQNDANKAKADTFRKTFRRNVLAELGSARTIEQVAETARKLWDEEFSVLGSALVAEMGGPAALVGGKENPKPEPPASKRMTDEELEATGRRFAKN